MLPCTGCGCVRVGTHLDGDVALGYLPHVEPDCRDHVLVELTALHRRGRGGEGRGVGVGGVGMGGVGGGRCGGGRGWRGRSRHTFILLFIVCNEYYCSVTN